MKYQITGYQLIYADGRRDTVKLLQPVTVEDIEEFRSIMKAERGCSNINLSYTEIY